MNAWWYWLQDHKHAERGDLINNINFSKSPLAIAFSICQFFLNITHGTNILKRHPQTFPFSSNTVLQFDLSPFYAFTLNPTRGHKARCIVDTSVFFQSYFEKTHNWISSKKRVVLIRDKVTALRCNRPFDCISYPTIQNRNGIGFGLESLTGKSVRSKSIVWHGKASVNAL